MRDGAAETERERERERVVGHPHILYSSTEEVCQNHNGVDGNTSFEVGLVTFK